VDVHTSSLNNYCLSGVLETEDKTPQTQKLSISSFELITLHLSISIDALDLAHWIDNLRSWTTCKHQYTSERIWNENSHYGKMGYKKSARKCKYFLKLERIGLPSRCGPQSQVFQE
jgi:hypothetical protein